MVMFKEILNELLAGKKVRCKSWSNPKSCIYKTKWGQIYSHKETPAYFMYNHFTATDWEIVGEPKCKLCNEYRRLNSDGMCDLCSEYLMRRVHRITQDCLKDAGIING